MDDNLEQRKKLLYEQVGEETLEILRESGIDVDNGITKILKEQEKQKERIEVSAEFGTIDDIMTSELVYRSSIFEDVFGREYTRRLQLLGLNSEQIDSIYQAESLILSKDYTTKQRKKPWVRRYFIMSDSTPENLPQPSLLTLSELVLITDDANAAMWRDHEVMPEEAMGAACIAANCFEYTEGRYFNELKQRATNFGFLNEQLTAFVRNECILTSRLKWGYDDKSSWTKETTDLQKYQR